MKKLSIIVSCLGVTSAAFAQGTLIFANLAGGVNAPVTNSLTEGRINHPVYLADLYFSTTTSSSTDTLQPAGFNVPFSTITALGGGGFFLGGTRTVLGASGTIIAQVRAWNSQFGASYEEARNNPANFFAQYGNSGTFLVNLAIPPVPPPSLTGLIGFRAPFFLIPEPSTFALAGLGAAALLIFRRRM